MAVRSSSKTPASTSATPALLPQGKHTGKPSLPISRSFTLIGSRHRAHLHLLSESVSNSHAVLVNDEGNVYIRDTASREHVYVNGEAILETELTHGDTLKIGSFSFKLSDPTGKSGRVRPERPPAAALEVEDNSLPILFEGRTILIGRRPTSDVLLNEAAVSNVHAIIYECAGRHHLRDLGSRTGTFVNGEQIHSHALTFNEVIRVGDTELRFVAAATENSLDELEHLIGTAKLGEESLVLAKDDAARLAQTASLATARDMETRLSVVEAAADAFPLLPAAAPPSPAATQSPVAKAAVIESPRAGAGPIARPAADLIQIDVDSGPDASTLADTKSLPPEPPEVAMPPIPVLSSRIVDSFDQVVIERVVESAAEDPLDQVGDHEVENAVEQASNIKLPDRTPDSFPTEPQEVELNRPQVEQAGHDEAALHVEPTADDFGLEFEPEEFAGPANISAVPAEELTESVGPTGPEEELAVDADIRPVLSAPINPIEEPAVGGDLDFKDDSSWLEPAEHPSDFAVTAHEAAIPDFLPAEAEPAVEPEQAIAAPVSPLPELETLDQTPLEQPAPAEVPEEFITAESSTGSSTESSAESQWFDHDPPSEQSQLEIPAIADEDAARILNLPIGGAVPPPFGGGVSPTEANGALGIPPLDERGVDFQKYRLPEMADEPEFYDDEYVPADDLQSTEVLTQTEPTPESAQHLELQLERGASESAAQEQVPVDELSDSTFGRAVADFSGSALGSLVEQNFDHLPAAPVLPADPVAIVHDAGAMESFAPTSAPVATPDSEFEAPAVDFAKNEPPQDDTPEFQPEKFSSDLMVGHSEDEPTGDDLVDSALAFLAHAESPVEPASDNTGFTFGHDATKTADESPTDENLPTTSASQSGEESGLTFDEIEAAIVTDTAVVESAPSSVQDHGGTLADSGLDFNDAAPLPAEPLPAEPTESNPSVPVESDYDLMSAAPLVTSTADHTTPPELPTESADTHAFPEDDFNFDFNEMSVPQTPESATGTADEDDFNFDFTPPAVAEDTALDEVEAAKALAELDDSAAFNISATAAEGLVTADASWTSTEPQANETGFAVPDEFAAPVPMEAAEAEGTGDEAFDNQFAPAMEPAENDGTFEMPNDGSEIPSDEIAPGAISASEFDAPLPDSVELPVNEPDLSPAELNSDSASDFSERTDHLNPPVEEPAVSAPVPPSVPTPAATYSQARLAESQARQYVVPPIASTPEPREARGDLTAGAAGPAAVQAPRQLDPLFGMSRDFGSFLGGVPLPMPPAMPPQPALPPKPARRSMFGETLVSMSPEERRSHPQPLAPRHTHLRAAEIQPTQDPITPPPPVEPVQQADPEPVTPDISPEATLPDVPVEVPPLPLISSMAASVEMPLPPLPDPVVNAPVEVIATMPADVATQMESGPPLRMDEIEPAAEAGGAPVSHAAPPPASKKSPATSDGQQPLAHNATETKAPVDAEAAPSTIVAPAPERVARSAESQKGPPTPARPIKAKAVETPPAKTVAPAPSPAQSPASRQPVAKPAPPAAAAKKAPAAKSVPGAAPTSARAAAAAAAAPVPRTPARRPQGLGNKMPGLTGSTGPAMPAPDIFSQNGLDATLGSEIPVIPPASFIPPGSGGANRARSTGLRPAGIRPPVARHAGEAQPSIPRKPAPRKAPVVEPLEGVAEEMTEPSEETLREQAAQLLAETAAEPEKKPKKKWKFPFFKLVFLAVTAGVGAAGAWFGMPPKADIRAAMKFDGLKDLDAPARAEFERGQISILNSPDLRRRAQAVYETDYHGTPGVGFLYAQNVSDAAAFAGVVDHAASSDDRLVLSRSASTTPDSDADRLRSILKALYDMDQSTVESAMQRRIAQDATRAQLADAERHVHEVQLQLDDDQKRQTAFVLARQKVKDQSDLTAQLESAWKEKSRRVKMLKEELAAGSVPTTSSSAEPLPAESRAVSQKRAALEVAMQAEARSASALEASRKELAAADAEFALVKPVEPDLIRDNIEQTVAMARRDELSAQVTRQTPAAVLTPHDPRQEALAQVIPLPGFRGPVLAADAVLFTVVAGWMTFQALHGARQLGADESGAYAPHISGFTHHHQAMA